MEKDVKMWILSLLFDKLIYIFQLLDPRYQSLKTRVRLYHLLDSHLRKVLEALMAECSKYSCHLYHHSFDFHYQDRTDCIYPTMSICQKNHLLQHGHSSIQFSILPGDSTYIIPIRIEKCYLLTLNHVGVKG